MKKLIIKTIAQTLLWMTIVFSYALGIFAFAFPKSMADFNDLIGNERMSAVYNERVYKKNPTDGNLYRVFSKYITSNISDSKIIEYGEKFLMLDNYNEIIQDINLQIIANEIHNPFLGLLCNEDNRLRRGLIGAHIRTGNMNRAIELFHEVIKVDQITEKDLLNPSYAIFEFGNNANMELRSDFEEYHSKFVVYYENSSYTDVRYIAAYTFSEYALNMYKDFYNG